MANGKDDDDMAYAPLNELDNTKTRLVKVADVLIINELKNLLNRQQKQDDIIIDLRNVIVDLTAGMLASIESIHALERAVATLESHRTEMLARQDKISELCDHLAQSLAGVTED